VQCGFPNVDCWGKTCAFCLRVHACALSRGRRLVTGEFAAASSTHLSRATGETTSAAATTGSRLSLTSCRSPEKKPDAGHSGFPVATRPGLTTTMLLQQIEVMHRLRCSFVDRVPLAGGSRSSRRRRRRSSNSNHRSSSRSSRSILLPQLQVETGRQTDRQAEDEFGGR